MSCKLNFKNKTIKAIALGSVLLSVPMWGLIANAAEFPLIIKRADTGPCDYNNFEVDSNGALILNLVDSNECNLVDAIKDSRTGTGVDSDEDGFSDLVELYAGTNINDANEKPADLDQDGTPDTVDSDKDGDGFNNDVDAFPNDPDKHEADPDDPPPPVGDTPTSLAREPDILSKFNNAYPAYASTAQLWAQSGSKKILVNGVEKKVYIINQGGLTTSAPSRVNGKDPQTARSSNDWRLGAKKNEIYSVRLKRNPDFPLARIAINRNLKSNGAVTHVDSKYHISDKPGDMTGGAYGDNCGLTTNNFSGIINIKSPSSNELNKCAIPENEVFYLNIELADSAFQGCNIPKANRQLWEVCCDDADAVCSGYFVNNALATPDALFQQLPQ
ncbi:MAG: hypothetical protein V3U71_13615 [Cocleimonas sp.]